jgi:site-specific recombinase
MFQAVVGVLGIGFFNVTVSFGMAFWVAVKARAVNPPQRRAIRRAVMRRLLKEPLSFLLPVGSSVARASESGHSH